MTVTDFYFGFSFLVRHGCGPVVRIGVCAWICGPRVLDFGTVGLHAIGPFAFYVVLVFAVLF
jgi:hypothetical protein